MSISTSNSSGSKLNSPVVLAVLVVVILLAVFLAFKFAPHQDVMKLKETPAVAFMKQKAVECKGDFSKLSPADQQKVQQLSNGYGAMSISNYYQVSQRGK